MLDNSGDLIMFQAMENVWINSPWGIAIIGNDGNVHSVNPAFEISTGLAATRVIGKSEATFDSLVAELTPSRNRFNRNRVESKTGGVRAIHYFSEPLPRGNQTLQNASALVLLRDPLTSIYGFAELLLSQNYDAETRHMLLSTLLEQADIMLNIINNNFE